MKITVIRSWLRMAVVLLATGAVIYACNWVAFNGCSWTKVRSEEAPVNVTFAVTDQFGKPASGYKFCVRLDYIAWYHWIVPPLALRSERYVVQTDGDGIAKLHPFLKKGLRMNLEEVQGQDYIFPGRELPNPMFQDNPASGFVVLRDIGDRMQFVPLRVLRHGEAIEAFRYAPTTTSREDGIEVDAQDRNVFTLDLRNNKLVEGKEDGTLTITVENATRACELYRFYRSAEPRPPLPQGPSEWSIRFEGQKGVQLIDAAGAAPVYAPEGGYKNALLYLFAVGDKAPPGAMLFGGSIERLQASKTEPTGETYYIFRTLGSLWRTFYVRSNTPRYYAYLRIMVDLDVRGDKKLLIRTSGFCNPDGSNNLWRGKR